MTEALAHILEEVEHLSADERAELNDRLVEMMFRDIPAEIQRAHLDEVRRRVAELESGKAVPIPGEEVLVEVRRIAETGNLADTEERDAVREAITRGQKLSSGAVPGRAHEEVMQAARRAIERG